MSKLFLFLAIASSLSACTETVVKKETSQAIKTETAPMVGGDRDTHGCIASAGYQWSIVKNECIRIFESGIRLNAKAKGLDTTYSAFVVFKSDNEDAQAEMFLVGNKNVILTKDAKDGAGKWTNTDYVLTQYKGMYSLEDNKKTLLYQGMKKQ